MQESSLGQFHSELLKFLKMQVENRIEDHGLDPAYDIELKSLLKGLSPASTDQALQLNEIIDNYQHLFNDKGPVYLEKVVMEAFPVKDFVKLGLGRYYPRMYRGLPRLYHRDFPTQSHIKKPFTHLPSLKKQAVSRALYSLYSKVPAVGTVTLFTWIINDGLGDYVAAIEVMMLLEACFPALDVRFVGLVHEKLALKLKWPENSILIEYKKDCPLDLINKEALKTLRESDLIIQLPTYYPHFDELLKKLKKKRSKNKMPKIQSIGEYGFLESNWFHPKSGNTSLGLHFLEKGILIRKPLKACWDMVENEWLKSHLRDGNHFYLAYLSSPIGGAIYLHSLLKSLEHDDQGIDLCVPDLNWFFKFVEKQKQANKTVLEWDLGISAIEIYFEEHFHSIPVSETGKKLRLLCPGSISQNDFRALLSLSGNWVGVRGNQSFSEAISQGKAFFYDGREHSRYFIKDLQAMAENRIGGYPGALECIRGIANGFVYNLPVQEEDWVDETFFQTIEEWTVIALNIGLSLQDPETYVGYRHLSQIIIQERSANHFICHLVQRAFLHRKYPELEQKEAENLGKFVSGVDTFEEFISSQKSLIELSKN